MRRKIKGAESKVADHSAYIRHCEWYLKNGDWIDDRYGEYQQNKIVWNTVVARGET